MEKTGRRRTKFHANGLVEIGPGGVLKANAIATVGTSVPSHSCHSILFAEVEPHSAHHIAVLGKGGIARVPGACAANLHGRLLEPAELPDALLCLKEGYLVPQ